MSAPKDELPDVEQIRQLALTNIPAHIVLRDVRCTYGSDFPQVLPEDYEITIEYEKTPDAPPAGTNAAIEACQAWSHTLLQDIRTQWPPETVRITFSCRTTAA